MTARNELKTSVGHSHATDSVLVRTSDGLDDAVCGIIKDIDGAILVTTAYDRTVRMCCHDVDVWRSDRLSTGQASANDIEESKHTSVIGDNKLVLLSVKPSHARSTVIFFSTGCELEAMADRTVLVA